MNLSLSLDAKEVLFHLNYMGYRNVSKEQLKSFMIDLKKLIKYESSPRESTEINIQAGPSTINIQRLFEAHTITSKTKQKEKAGESSKAQSEQQQQPRVHQRQILIKQRIRPATLQEITELREAEEARQAQTKPQRVKSADTARKGSVTASEKPKQQPTSNVPKKVHKPSEPADKENIPEVPAKSKMWIRPKSGSQAQRKPVKRNDPVALYQAYQKDWEKFKNNICESSHSDLRWTIREKMMGNN